MSDRTKIGLTIVFPGLKPFQHGYELEADTTDANWVIGCLAHFHSWIEEVCAKARAERLGLEAARQKPQTTRTGK